MRKSPLRSAIQGLTTIWTSPAGFCMLIALAAVMLRLIIFDYPTFFKLQAIPSHDMHQAMSFFATSMHSLRLGGEIAWWNPIAKNGYAQYYQSFLSPLAPTPHHIVFIIWAQIILFLNWLGLQIPEYFQYLTINYIVFPYLTFLGFSALCSLLFRQRVTIVLLLIVYVFSGIGLWYSAWFYFQESCSLFFLLAAAISALQSPNLRTICIFLTALLIQLISFNYWTLYNAWFILIFLVTYIWNHQTQTKNLSVKVQEILNKNRYISCAIGGLISITLLIWGVMIISILAEQASHYVRTEAPQGHFSVVDAYRGVQETRNFTTELFNPNFLTRLQHYPSQSPPMHYARYIGSFLIPFLCLLPAYRWQRRERWLVGASVLILITCFASPLLLIAWDTVPFMNRIRHFFHFYSHYWQIMVLLIAGIGIDLVLGKKLTIYRKQWILVIATLAGIAMLSLLIVANLSFLFPFDSSPLEGGLRFAIVILLCSILILQFLLFPSIRHRQLLVTSLLVIALTDMTQYFWRISQIDREFTNQKRYAIEIPYPLPENITNALRSPWSIENIQEGFQVDLFKNFPVKTLFWPVNDYVVHNYIFKQLSKTPESFQKDVLDKPPISFYSEFQVVEHPDQVSAALQITSKQKKVGQKATSSPLLLQKTPKKTSLTQPIFSVSTQVDQDLSYTWQDWRYNSFTFEVNSPQAGWIFIRQVFDPLWKVQVDHVPTRVRQANFGGMAVVIPSGKHLIHMEYRPLARSLYWIASLLLEITLFALGWIAYFANRLQPAMAKI